MLSPLSCNGVDVEEAARGPEVMEACAGRRAGYAAIRGLWKNNACPIVARTVSREKGFVTR